MLCVPIHARLQIFTQLAATLTKLCHIKRNHPVEIICAKCPPSAEMHAGIFWHFPKQLKFLIQTLHAYCTFIFTLECKFLFNYLQLWRSYAILSATTQRAFQLMENILSIWWCTVLIGMHTWNTARYTSALPNTIIIIIKVRSLKWHYHIKDVAETLYKIKNINMCEAQIVQLMSYS